MSHSPAAMQPFEYLTPKTLREAIDALARHNGQARALAGGTDLLVQMKEGRTAPKVIVNVKRISELRRRYVFDGALTLGALTTLEEIRQSCLVCEHYPALADAAATI